MVHAWEVDPEQPALPGTRLNRWRHRVNLRHTESRLERLLGDFRFAPAREVLRLSRETERMAEPLLVGPDPFYAPMD